MLHRTRKETGAYYTPESVATTLLRWAVWKKSDRLLDPSCGDGRFIAHHRNSVGIEQDSRTAGYAMQRAPWALIHDGDFFSWAANTTERFDCAAGNPPFIRYQTFSGDTRQRALNLCSKLGADFSGLASSWAPFLVAAASLLHPEGRMAFVVPAEIGHAPYAAPLLDYLLKNFRTVQLVAVREKLFPELSEDCWLLYAEGYGSSASGIRFSTLDKFRPSEHPPKRFENVSTHEWKHTWKCRLRPFLMAGEARELYQVVARKSHKLGDYASVGIGYVSGANNFFHLRPSDVDRWGIPENLLHPSVRNGRALPARSVTSSTVDKWRQADDPILLLRIPKEISLPLPVRRYLDTTEGHHARTAYKCRMRDPWYSVPDVQVPDFFLTYMSGVRPSLVRNDADCTCTNSLHSVRLKDKRYGNIIAKGWDAPIVQLSCEIEGHPLGGGMLKLEPREATQIILSNASGLEGSSKTINEAIWQMRAWRHYRAD